MEEIAAEDFENATTEHRINVIFPLTLVDGGDRWGASFDGDVPRQESWWDEADELPRSAMAETAPLAICLAALKTIGVKIEV